MNNYLPLLQTTTLFAGLSAAELSTLLSRLGGSVSSYGKGEALVLAGEPSRRVGIVLSGELEAYRDHWCGSYGIAYADYDRNRILGKHTGSNSTGNASAYSRDSGSNYCGNARSTCRKNERDRRRRRG